ncbi:DUF3298 and DUF4163 domain-containing protein [Pedobacter sp. GR22-10]|uniref:DUF3298 and DUF4163 domain-containing protein n=1 Tax=Pedobacter sp. GR22-10 TaxID=2994472 RepID=UPI0022481238|nr:DUF3298 and DUF4163 domain-containing protein [Pedobacter sp. GR22-10]MCX2429358.1 DUF3298 domain-containing protein [Pedobacter sp. GR22-10]
MKKHLLFYLLLSVIISACNNNKSKSNHQETADTAQNVKREFKGNFYKRLEGTIAGKPVVMNLQRLDGDLDGNYYYDGSWLNLSTDTVISQDSLILSEYSFYTSYFDQNSKEPHLHLKWTGNGFKGTWKSGDESKSFPILLEEKYPEGSYELTTGIYQDSVVAFTNKSNSPTAEITFEYLKATATDDSGNWINSELKKIDGLKASADREVSFKSIAAAYFKDYKSQIAEQQKESKNDDFEGWMNYTNSSQQTVLYNENGYVVIDFLADAYTGGAHGNYSSTMYCLDVKNKKQLVLGDIVKIDSNNLQKLLEKNLRKLYNIKPNDAISTVLFDDYLKPNKNFYFNSKGLAFMYNPYEVASYAQGQIVVFIPFNELKTYLVPSFAERIGVK